MNYAVGFYCSKDFKKTVMIKKQKPAWMADKYNGIGGKRDEAEAPRVSMARIFEEQTGVFTRAVDWHCFHIEQYRSSKLDSIGNKIYYFVTVGDLWDDIRSLTEEEVSVLEYETADLNELVFNVSYLWLMILTHVKNKTLNILNPEGVNSK